jgi:hypothetical protein
MLIFQTALRNVFILFYFILMGDNHMAAWTALAKLTSLSQSRPSDLTLEIETSANTQINTNHTSTSARHLQKSSSSPTDRLLKHGPMPVKTALTFGFGNGTQHAKCR